MSKVCIYVREAVEVISQFQRFLGPELKAVIRYEKGIEELVTDVQQLSRIFCEFGDCGFKETSAAQWETLMAEFRRRVKHVEEKALLLLDSRFKKLRSAVGAFTMLKNFSTIKSRPCINAKLQEKFVEIVIQFGNEVHEAREHFKAEKENPPVSKCYTPVAGAIAWARGILQRLKAPVLEFKCMPALFQSDEAERVFTNYLEFARELSAYQADVYNKWQVRTSNTVANCLKMNVLKLNADGKKYEVNFAPSLWVVMQETRYLAQMDGHEIPHTILNIALQKEKYMEHCSLLQLMLDNLESACGNMEPVQEQLLSTHLEKLDRHLRPGASSLNWTSLGLEEFTNVCNKAITAFKTLRDQVEKNAEIIERIVLEIENAELVRSIDWDKDVPFNVQEIYEFFEKHRASVVSQLQAKYETIPSHIIKIEEIVEGTMTGASETMVNYYKYWERRIYLAICAMLIRGTSTFRALFSLHTSGIKVPPLIAVNADLNQSEVVVHGSTQAIFKVLSKLMQNILSSASQFVRWMDGTCRSEFFLISLTAHSSPCAHY